MSGAAKHKEFVERDAARSKRQMAGKHAVASHRVRWHRGAWHRAHGPEPQGFAEKSRCISSTAMSVIDDLATA
jgi:hypothetical protein